MAAMALALALPALGSSTLSAHAQDRAALEAAFRAWLENEIWPEARREGISRATFDAAFDGVRLNLDLPELQLGGPDAPPAIDQAEFRSPAPYFNEDNLAALAREGRRRLAAWADTLAAIERRYGVPASIVLAIWGRETSYGEVALRYDAVRSLATHAFIGRRPAFFRPELIAALKILERGEATRAELRSSWAGAIGGFQLLPAAYLEYAVDFDGDGRRATPGSVPDTLATIANHLGDHGWEARSEWGAEAVMPAPELCTLEGPNQGRPLDTWLQLGFAWAAGANPSAGQRERRFLVAPAGALGLSFLVTENFYVLKDYNNSDLYGLFVGQLADRIAGEGGAFLGSWGRVEPIVHANILGMQERLVARGYDVGTPNGIAGFRTRIAIGAFEASAGLPVTCYPSARAAAALG
jgi:lytic murein transglycosylase